MCDVVAIDPGLNRSGVAVFRDGVLIFAAMVKVPREGSELERAERMGQALVFEACSYTSGDALLVFEWPQIYDSRNRGKVKGQDPNDLLPLAAIGGVVASAFKQKKIVRPSEWKGQVPKPKKGEEYIVERRVRKRLEAVELAAVPSDAPHDVWDAVGVGLYALGRFEKRRGSH